ncbi:MAG: hypothetical protein M1819_001440 [Sarea resinae]|nr:MAG: hypothetical protein M1819_001440 [Sarea resinae]
MDRTPQSLRSSVSPYQQCGRTSGYRRITSHPSSPHNEPKSMHPGPENALGLYGYNIPTSSSKVTTGNLLPPSPQPSELWARPSVTEQSLSYCSQPPQDIFSAAYDPFANVSNNPPPSFMRPAFTSGPPDGPEYRTTSMTSPSNVPSHRSSFSSTCTTSEAYSHPGSELGYTPKVKIEDTNEWYTGSSNHSNMHAQMAGQRLVSSPQHHGPVHVPLPTMQRPQSAAWSNYDLRSENNGGQYDESSRSDSYRHPKSDTEHPIITDVARTRKRRQLTTPSEANHECRVCGKLFGRSYNYKAHMDTHDPARVYPHICSVRNCNKKFVRKTDLVRHEDSVRQASMVFRLHAN